MPNSHILHVATLLFCAHWSATLIRAGNISTASYDTPSYLDIQSTAVSKDGTNAVVTVVRSGDFRNIASVDYATKDGTAVAGEDYKPVGGRLVFQEGEGFKTIVVPILMDTNADGAEAFTVVLSNPGTSSIITHD